MVAANGFFQSEIKNYPIYAGSGAFNCHKSTEGDIVTDTTGYIAIGEMPSYRDVFINRPLSYMEAMFEVLIKLGYMKPGNPKIYAMDLYSPFFMYHTIQGDNAEVVKALREHVNLFRKNVVTDEV